MSKKHRRKDDHPHSRRHPSTFLTPSVYACWHIARSAARAYQRQANTTKGLFERALCLAARDAADRIALKIRYGTRPE